MRDPDQLTCRELVELVTDYFEDALPADERARFEQHVAYCDPCVNYLGQMRRTAEIVGALREDHVHPDARAALLSAFRGWNWTRRMG
jgi:anti-sigma factor RsiW